MLLCYKYIHQVDLNHGSFIVEQVDQNMRNVVEIRQSVKLDVEVAATPGVFSKSISHFQGFIEK